MRNQMMTYLKHVGNFKHAELKIKKFEEVQALYEKIKRSDEDFISIGSAEDERLIKRMDEKGVDSSKDEMIKEESKEEVEKESKAEVQKESKEEEGLTNFPLEVDMVTSKSTKSRMYTFSPMMVANSRKHHCRVRSYTREVLVISTNLDIQKNHYPLDFRNRRGDEARIKNTWYNQGLVNECHRRTLKILLRL
ncbi:hypothetical protein Tco_1077828 [Tanacetum coccineum]